METGDDRYLPARDRGPVRRFARDFVDARRTVGQYLLPVFFVIFVLAAVVPEQMGIFSTYAWFGVVCLMVADAVRLTRGVKAGIAQRFPDSDSKGITLYTIMRGWQMRRLRLPKPQVTYGDKV